MNSPQSEQRFTSLDIRMKSRICVRLMALLLPVFIVGCGGGGGGGSTVTATEETPPAAPARLGGTIRVAESVAVDSDTNDPNQVGFKSNNTVAGAQTLPNPVLLSGHLSVAGQGPAGRTFQTGDPVDVYRMNLVAGQVVELAFGAPASSFDVDLALFDEAGELVGLSYGVSDYECVYVARSGNYFVVPIVYPQFSTGSTTYALLVAPPGAGSPCANATINAAGIVSGEIVATANEASTSPKADKALTDSGIAVVAGKRSPSEVVLLSLPGTAQARQKGVEALTETTSAGRGQLVAKSVEAVNEFRSRLPASAQEILSTVEYAKALTRSGLFSIASPNRIASSEQAGALIGPFPSNDAEYSRVRWNLDLVSAPSAMSSLLQLSPQPSQRPVVAVLDTGVVLNHPDLQGQLVAGFDFVSQVLTSGDGDGIDANADDLTSSAGGIPASFHGSHVAGTIAARTFNGIGIAGVAPMAQIMPVRVLGSRGGGTTFDIVHGIRFAAGLANVSGVAPARRADVINLSLGGSGTCDPLYQAAIDDARRQGVVVVAAAGNDSTATRVAPVGQPANCAGVIAVSAVNSSIERASYSNGGPQILLAAPGGESGDQQVYSTVASFVGGVRVPGYAGQQGTSMAAPHVAATIALMKWVNPSISPAAVEQSITTGAITTDIGEPGRDAAFGHGLVNARKAVDFATASIGRPLPAGAVEVQPSSVVLGSIRTRAELLVQAIGPTSDRVASVTAAGPQVVVTPKGGSVNSATGLGTYVVTANRDAMQAGTSATVFIRVTLESGQVREVPITLERRASGAGSGDAGPIYVFAFDVDDPKFSVLAQTKVDAPTAGIYRYSMTLPAAKRVVVLAGSDINNDRDPCSWAEACGAFPSLGPDLAIIDTSFDRAELDFSVSPFLGLNTVTAAPPSAKPPTTTPTPPPASQISISITDNVPGTAVGPVTFTFTFAAPVSGFTASDVQVAGGTPGAFAQISPSIYTLVVTPAAVTQAGQIILNVPVGAGTGAAGNPTGAGAAIQAYDTAPPAVAISNNAPPVANGPVTFTFTFSETVTGFDAGDIAISGGSLVGGSFSGSGTTYVAQVMPTAGAAGTMVVGVPAGVAVDAVALPNRAAANSLVAYDRLAPTVAITDNTPGTASGPVVFTFMFSEPVSGFTAADIVVSAGTVSAFGGSGAFYTATVTPPVGSGTFTVNVAAGAAVDAAGNSSTAAPQASQAYAPADSTPPTVAIADNVAGIATGPVAFTFTFSEPVTGFTASDIALSAGTVGAFAGSGAVYTATILPPAGTGTFTVNVPAGAATDAAGNPSTAAPQASQAYAPLDVTPPSVAITDNTPGTATGPVVFTFTFSEPVTGFASNDIVLSAGTLSGFGGSGAVYTAIVTPPAGSGTFTVNVPAGVAIDAVGNSSTGAQASQAYQ